MAGALRSRALTEMEERARVSETVSDGPPIPRSLTRRELDPNRELSDRGNLALTDVAVNIGSTVGRAVSLLNRAEEIGDQVRRRARELQQAGTLRVQEARRRSERLVRERPLHVLAAIGCAAFVIGVALRIVRSRHASRY